MLILVSLHEFGHYCVARLCGVKVLRFSIGFGKPFFTKKRGDTEWCLAPIPLGGYVKMVDTRDPNQTVKHQDLAYAFDQQHPAKKIAIVIAGPLTNLILAVILYAASFSMGITELKPYIGTVAPHSIAAQAGFQAGDKIQTINQQTIHNWTDIQTTIFTNIESQPLNITVQTQQGQTAQRFINIAHTPQAEQWIEQGSIGISPFKITTTLAHVQANSAADRAGLQAGDTLISADGKTLTHWHEWTQLIRQSAGKKLAIVYQRNQQQYRTQLRPHSQDSEYGLIGVAGFAPKSDKTWDNAIRLHYQPSINEAMQTAWQHTGKHITIMLDFLKKLIIGDVSTKHISGPISIADAAGKSAQMGIQSYLSFLAMISVSLGVMNLLPIPVLDGGHLVYYAIEWIRGKPLSKNIQHLGLKIGLAMMALLMFLAFFNDITRLIG